MNDSKRLEDIREFKRLLLKKNSEIKKLQRGRDHFREGGEYCADEEVKLYKRIASLELVRKASDNFRQDIIENSDGILSDWDSWLDFDAALNQCEREWPK